MPAPVADHLGPNPGAALDRPSFTLEFLAIAVGGMLGSTLRHAISVLISVSGLHSAFAAGSANAMGSLLLGLVAGRLAPGASHPLWRPFLMVGVFGSFTTFSTLALDNRRLAGNAGEAAATGHLLVAVATGLGAFVLGQWMGRGGHPRRGRERSAP